MNDHTPLSVFLDVQDILFHELLLGQDYWDAVEQAWDDVYATICLWKEGLAFSPLSMLTSVRGYGSVSCM